jgi:hypothetical protein
MPCATIASMPAAFIARASSRLVAVAIKKTPRACSAEMASAEGKPKWKLTTGGATSNSIASMSGSSAKLL